MRRAWAPGARHGTKRTFKTTRLRLRFGLGASPRQRLRRRVRRCHWGLQGFRSTAAKPAQERIDPAAQSRTEASSINITVAAESCNVQRSRRFASFATRNAKHALLIRPSAARSLSKYSGTRSWQLAEPDRAASDPQPKHSSPPQAARKRSDTQPSFRVEESSSAPSSASLKKRRSRGGRR